MIKTHIQVRVARHVAPLNYTFMISSLLWRMTEMAISKHNKKPLVELDELKDLLMYIKARLQQAYRNSVTHVSIFR